MAKSMFSAGVRENDVIGIVSENRLEFPVISFAAFYLGAIVSPINITYTERKFISDDFFLQFLNLLCELPYQIKVLLSSCFLIKTTSSLCKTNK